MPHQLTPAQLELQAARRAAKLAKAAARRPTSPKLSPEDLERRRFLRREWVEVRREKGTEGSGQRSVKIVTWNLLAQTLVRRELFPGSDCLKWGDRKPMLLGELEYHSSADIICFQECDRLKDLLPSVPHHSHVTASGPGKLHGLVILYRAARYHVRASRTLHLDMEELCPSQGDTYDVGQVTAVNISAKRKRRGGSRQTKNVALIVALEDMEDSTRGVVITTTHLFWHPKFPYERTRQSLILLRSVLAFGRHQDITTWPSIIAGDFNTQPSEATYQLLTSPQSTLSPDIIRQLSASRLVHTSVDKIGLDHTSAPESNSVSTSNAGTGANTPVDEDEEDEDDGKEELPDNDERSVAGTRLPLASDGLLKVDDLIAIAQSVLNGKGCMSAYDNSTWSSNQAETYGGRGGSTMSGVMAGLSEPAYTCYTPLFKLTLGESLPWLKKTMEINAWY